MGALDLSAGRFNPSTSGSSTVDSPNFEHANWDNFRHKNDACSGLWEQTSEASEVRGKELDCLGGNMLAHAGGIGPVAEKYVVANIGTETLAGSLRD